MVYPIVNLGQEAQAADRLPHGAAPFQLPAGRGTDADNALLALGLQFLHLPFLPLNQYAVYMDVPAENQVLRVPLEIPQQFLALAGQQPRIPDALILPLPLPQAHHGQVVAGRIDLQGVSLRLFIDFLDRHLPFKHLFKKIPFGELLIFLHVFAQFLQAVLFCLLIFQFPADFLQ